MKGWPILIALIVLCSCGEGEVDLGSGYKYVQLDGASYAISDRKNHMVVDPDVVRYKVLAPFIVGLRKNANIDNRLSKRFGYFIFDMRDEHLIEGLSGAQFENALHARNLPSHPF